MPVNFLVNKPDSNENHHQDDATRGGSRGMMLLNLRIAIGFLTSGRKRIVINLTVKVFIAREI